MDKVDLTQQFKKKKTVNSLLSAKKKSHFHPKLQDD